MEFVNNKINQRAVTSTIKVRTYAYGSDIHEFSGMKQRLEFRLDFSVSD
jgi:hypothetical protein